MAPSWAPREWLIILWDCSDLLSVLNPVYGFIRPGLEVPASPQSQSHESLAKLWKKKRSLPCTSWR